MFASALLESDWSVTDALIPQKSGHSASILDGNRTETVGGDGSSQLEFGDHFGSFIDDADFSFPDDDEDANRLECIKLRWAKIKVSKIIRF